MRRQKTALPIGIAEISGEEALGDGAASTIAYQRRLKLTLDPQDVADLVVRHQKIVLPARITAIRGGQALANGEAQVVARERLIESALGDVYIAHLDVAQRKVTRLAGIAGIGGETLGDDAARAVFRERLLEPALGLQHVPQLVVAHREVMLPGKIARVFGGEPLYQPIRFGRPRPLQFGITERRVIAGKFDQYRSIAEAQSRRVATKLRQAAKQSLGRLQHSHR